MIKEYIKASSDKKDISLKMFFYKKIIVQRILYICKSPVFVGCIWQYMYIHRLNCHVK